MRMFKKESLKERVEHIEKNYALDEVWIGGCEEIKLADAISQLYNYLGLEFGCKKTDKK